MNVADQAPFAEAQEELLGVGHSYPMLAYGTLKTKSAFKLYARANNVDPEIANNVTKQIDRYESAVRYADEDDKDLIDITDYVEEQYIPYIEKSKAYLGIVVSKSQAPCGYLIYNGDIRSEIGLMRVNSASKKTSVLCTVIDGATADAFGYVKNDLLTVAVIKVNSETMKRAGIPPMSSQEVFLKTARDQDTWRIFAQGWTQGINQCQRDATIRKLKQYKPREFRDLCAFVAAIRPGFKAQINQFLARERFKYGVPPFDQILRNDSTGSAWMLYQENAMTALSLAGFPLDRTYPIIKAISKKKTSVINAAHDEFMSGFQRYLTENQHVSAKNAEHQAELVWKVIEDSANYSFNACVSGDTLIRLSDGRHVRVENLFYVGAPYGSTCSMFDDGKLHPNQIVDVRLAGVRRLYYILTVSGQSIDCTDNHKFPTPDGIKRCDELRPGDLLYVVDPADCGQDGAQVKTSRILWIHPLGEEMTYDVEMADPAHNFVVNGGLITSNSHAACVSLDALYGAYLKAHYTHVYYEVLLEDYLAKGNKDKVSLIKQEMCAAFGYRIAPCAFRQDNRKFAINPVEKTITDSLASIKGVSAKSASRLYSLRSHSYDSFVDLLIDLDQYTEINKTVVDALIDTGYFAEFGGAVKLRKVADAFRTGAIHYDKKYAAKTKIARVAALKEFEMNTPDEDDPPEVHIHSEIKSYGFPMTTVPTAHNDYVVIEAEQKRRVKLKLFNMRNARIGTAFVTKAAFELDPLKTGDIIHIDDWKEIPARGYKNGRSVKLSYKEPWVYEYSIVGTDLQ